jgi:NAD(P)-dependent dehydrogenase (short-subunit alcohol dehydrogenase family)
MSTLPLEGRVVAFIGAGTEEDRSMVVALAEAGADLALATTDREQATEFAMNSIANEAWVLGREQFVTVMDALDDTAVTAFADQTWDRYKRCDALVCAHGRASEIALDEVAPHEWDDVLAANLKGPFLAAQAFGRLMEREGGGLIVFLAPAPGAKDAPSEAAVAGLGGLATAIHRSWGKRGVLTLMAPRTGGDVAAAVAANVPKR